MEFVAGMTLLDLIPSGGLRVPQVLRYSSQMADALSAAHAAGIIHRDFKPGNVMITSSGLVKVLDFGLAKLTDNSPVSQFCQRSEEHTSELQSHLNLVCRLLLEKKNKDDRSTLR